MKVDDETAEQLKRRYTFGLSDNNSISQLFAKGSDGKLKKYPYDLLKEIIDARVEHLILYICKLLNKSEISVSRKINMYLTGGGLAFIDVYKRQVSGYMVATMLLCIGGLILFFVSM